MDETLGRQKMTGCYVTIPTMFRDDADLSLDLDAVGRHVRFLIDGGLREGTGVLLAGGAAGDFSTMTFEERCAVVERVVGEAAGRIPDAMGGQTTSTRELERLVKAAEHIGADFVQVSPPFYFSPTEEKYTSGDGYLDKQCVELVGLGSSRSRPPTRDVRPQFREATRRMLLDAGVPNVLPA